MTTCCARLTVNTNAILSTFFSRYEYIIMFKFKLLLTKEKHAVFTLIVFFFFFFVSYLRLNVTNPGFFHKQIQYKMSMLGKDFISFLSVDKLWTNNSETIVSISLSLSWSVHSKYTKFRNTRFHFISFIVESIYFCEQFIKTWWQNYPYFLYWLCYTFIIALACQPAMKCTSKTKYVWKIFFICE